MQENTTHEKTKRKIHDWELLRNAIMHEDTLVNHRLTWLLTIEGFLIGGFFVMGKPGEALSVSAGLTAFIFFFASLVCLVALASMASAHDRITNIIRFWHKKYPEEKTDATRSLPAITGKSPFRGEYDDANTGELFFRNPLRAMWCSPLMFIPVILLIVDSVVIYYVIRS